MSIVQRVLVFLWVAATLAIAALAFTDAEAELRLNYSNGVQLLTAYLSGLLCFRTSRVFPASSPLRHVWSLMGAGVLAWAIGQSYFASYPLLHDGQETPFPSFAEFGYLLIGPLIVFALLRFRRATGLSAPAWGIALAFILLVGAAAAALKFNWEGIQSSDVALGASSLGYALFDPVLLAVTALVASGFAGGGVGKSWWYVVGGIIFYFVANLCYSYMVFNETYQTGSWTDIFWPLGFGLIALGAVATHKAFGDD
jgi:diguanylate cyclase